VLPYLKGKGVSKMSQAAEKIKEMTDHTYGTWSRQSEVHGVRLC
jgi:hypothetical protein